ncbi:hypothetical protein [Comamonas sp. JC664]|uniref:hypothetical protein n=1 Tax=Comamonas sp. JC664 TaxID=2801917 RepID=UPI00174D7CC5|nr:hypothetical protein [Comamonas sp. JC664]MBL0694295.1 hypothetical protein [Comamonas sp. JC664]GHG76856.1 hypothetical protein GCM10012319_26260 [Comamonas sp. KCTC 72670]
MRHSLLAVSLSFFVGCAHNARRADPVEFAPADLARRASMEPWAISMPFEQDQDGTDLVLALLDRAEASGARYVSDVQVVFMTKQGEQPLECRTPLVPQSEFDWVRESFGEREKDPEAPLALKPFTFSTVEFGCGAVASARLIRERRTAPSSVPVQTTQDAIRSDPLRWSTSCGYSRVMHEVERYVFQADVNYVPPLTYRIQQTRPELALVEDRAACVPATPYSPTVNRIEAVVYGGAGPKAALEAALRVHPVRMYL